jgi:hypothetical protein
MNERLIKELYETADRYQGRMAELCMLAIVVIQRQELLITKLEEPKK